MPCLYTHVNEDDELSVLTMISYAEGQEYRFLYKRNSWRLSLDDSGRRGKLTLNHDIRSVNGHLPTLPLIKIYQDSNGVWNSRVLYTKGEQVIKAPQHNQTSDTMLGCVAETLDHVYA